MPASPEFAGRLQPPREARTPREHYEIADALLAELDGLEGYELTLGYAKAKLAQAQIHAMLAQCDFHESEYIGLDELEAVRSRHPELVGDFTTCRHCLAVIVRDGEEWIHKSSGRAECWRDPQHTETATP